MSKETVEKMFSVGAHYGYIKARKHPSVEPYVYGVKDGVLIFDLEKTEELLNNAKAFVSRLAQEGKQILFVAGKRQAVRPLKDAAQKIDQPYAVGRWIGGTLTNFEEISKRVKRLEKLTEERDKGLLAKYTKKERLLIDREIDKLEERFGGITNMPKKPAALFIIDAGQEDITLKEAKVGKIPVISLVGSDVNIKPIDYPITANDTSVASISFFIDEIMQAYRDGAAKRAEKPAIATAKKADK